METDDRILNTDTELVALDKLTPHPRNVNNGDVPAIEESIRANGWYGFVSAQRSSGHVLTGNHRLEAARNVGMPEIPVVWLDVDDEEALRILLIDNRSTRRGTDDQEHLALLLRELHEQEKGLVGVGYDDDDLQNLLASTGILGREEGAFLDGLVGDVTSVNPSGLTGIEAPEDARQLVFALAPEVRAEVITSLRAAQAHFGVDNTASALVAVCAEWRGLHPAE